MQILLHTATSRCDDQEGCVPIPLLSTPTHSPTWSPLPFGSPSFRQGWAYPLMTPYSRHNDENTHSHTL